MSPQTLQSNNLEKAFLIITSGNKPVYLAGRRVLLSFPSANEALECEEAREEAELRAEEEGFLSKEDIKEFLVREGYIREEDVKMQESLVIEIDKLRSRTKGIKSARLMEGHLANITAKEKMLLNLRFKEDKFLFHTIEGKGSEIKAMALTRFCVLNRDGSKFWKTQEDMDNDNNIQFLNRIIPMNIDFLNGLETKTIRSISKLPEWRARWSAAKKTGAGIFKGDPAEYNSNQLLLIYWSSILDSVFEDSNPPGDNIIRDDELLDSWLENRSRKWEIERAQSNARTSGGDVRTFQFKG